jgi:hypothetical protein
MNQTPSGLDGDFVSPKPVVYKLYIGTLSRLREDFIAPHFLNFVFIDR